MDENTSILLRAAFARRVRDRQLTVHFFASAYMSYAAMAQKERELISERTKAALGAAKSRGAVLGGDRGCRPTCGPDAGAASLARRQAADRAAHRLLLEVERLWESVVTSRQALARTLTGRRVPAPQGGETWTHTTVGRLLARTDAQTV
jgi:DNA invertase Pin-like site-specific DNA recombinase